MIPGKLRCPIPLRLCRTALALLSLGTLSSGQAAPPEVRPPIVVDVAETPDAASLDRASLTPMTRLGTDQPQNPHFSLANRLYLDGRDRMAVEEYERYLLGWPHGANRAEAMFRMAECLRRLERWEVARAELQALAATYPGTWYAGAAAFQLAMVDLGRGQTADAIDQLRGAVESEVDGSLREAAEFQLAAALERAGDTLQAREWFEQIAARPTSVHRVAAYAAMARMAELRGDGAKVREYYEIILKITDRPEVRAEARLRLAEYRLQAGDTDGARADWLAAFDEPVGEGSRRSAVQREVLRQLATLESPEAWLTLVEPLLPRCTVEVRPEAMLQVARMHRENGDLAQAKTLFNEVQAGWPGQPAGWEAEIALLWLEDEEEEERALRIQELSKRKLPTAQRALLDLFRAREDLREGDWKAASKTLARIDPENLPPRLQPQMRTARMWCLWQEKKWSSLEKAADTFLDAHPADSSAPFAMLVRAMALREREKYSEALEQLARMLEGWPAARERAFALQQAGLLAGQTGESVKMRHFFEALLQEFPNHDGIPAAHFFLGRERLMNGDAAGALAHFDVVRVLDPCLFGDEMLPWRWAALERLEQHETLTDEIILAAPALPAAVLDSRLLLTLGEYWLRENRPDRAVPLLELAREAERTGLVGWLLARAQAESEAWEAAEATLESLAEAEDAPPVESRALLLGEVRRRLGKWEAAHADFERAAESAADPWTAARGALGAARVLLEQGSAAAALARLERLLSQYDDVRLTPQILVLALQAAERADQPGPAAEMRARLEREFPEALPRRLPPPPIQ